MTDQTPPLCNKCKERPRSRGRLTCKPCRTGDQAAYQRRVARYIAAGLCVACGLEKPKPGKRTCVDCLATQAAYAAKKRAGGVCAAHGLPLLPGSRAYCARCREYHQARHARDKAERAALRAQALAELEVEAEADGHEQGVTEMGKRNPNKTPPVGSLAEWVCKQPVDIDQDELAKQACAAGFPGTKGRSIYHARWYYGLIATRVAVRATEMKPLAVISGEVQAPVSEELVAAVLKHGTHAARAVIEAIEARGAARPAAAPAPVHQPLGKKVSA